MNNENKVALPYLDNWKTVLLTALINLPLAFIFHFAEGSLNRRSVVDDAIFCGVLTVVIDMTVVYLNMKRRREKGILPGNVPESQLMQRLPKNPALLALIYAPISALAIGLICWGIMVFFGIESFGFWNWLVFKLIYACLLSAKIVEYCIFRYIQPDWAGAANAAPADVVRNPLPKISTLKEVYGSISANIAMNMIIGTVMGGTVVGQEQVVLIYPTHASGIWVTGMIFGTITGLLLTTGVLSTAGQIIKSGALPPNLPPPDRRINWLPKSRAGLTAVICAAVAALSVVLLPLLLRVLGIEVMNFYQFCIFITAYGMFVCRVFTKLLTARCLQSDYINWVLEKG